MGKSTLMQYMYSITQSYISVVVSQIFDRTTVAGKPIQDINKKLRILISPVFWSTANYYHWIALITLAKGCKAESIFMEWLMTLSIENIFNDSVIHVGVKTT